MADRPYLFYELTNSLCSKCLRKVEAKVVFQDDCVFLLKHCPEHRRERVLISTDIDYYKLCRQALKPGQLPLHFNTAIDAAARSTAAFVPITNSIRASPWWRSPTAATSRARSAIPKVRPGGPGIGRSRK